MDISFETAKMAKLFNTEKKLRGEFGVKMVRVLQRRLFDLDAAETLEAMRGLPGRCHELTANLKGKLAVDLVQPNRLLFMPDHEPIPTLKDGGLNWKEVTAIVVVGVGDYH